MAISSRSVFVLHPTIIITSFATMILIASYLVLPLPSFADRIYAIHKGITLALGCDLSNDDDNFISTTKVFKYDQPNKLTFNCERPGGEVDLKKGESVALRCLHDNPLTIAKNKKMNPGELFYVICKY
jgi:hypothetical protein